MKAFTVSKGGPGWSHRNGNFSRKSGKNCELCGYVFIPLAVTAENRESREDGK